MSRKRAFDSLLAAYVRKAREAGFTDGDIRWVLREAKNDYLIESRKPGIHPGLMLDILKDKTVLIKAAQRIVREVCEELGIKTKGI